MAKMAIFSSVRDFRSTISGVPFQPFDSRLLVIEAFTIETAFSWTRLTNAHPPMPTPADAIYRLHTRFLMSPWRKEQVGGNINSLGKGLTTKHTR